MSQTISLKDAAKLAGVTLWEMREATFQNNMEPRAQAANVGNTKLDRDRFFRWLDERGAEMKRAHDEEKEIRYAEWLAENGEFLERFLAESHAI